MGWFKNLFIFGLVLLLLCVGLSGCTTKPECKIPSEVTGRTRQMYEWSNTSVGWELLEQIPCYCGCKNTSNHKHERDCFWTDDGEYDKHGSNCYICVDIAEKTKQLHEAGKDICEIRNTIDALYASDANLGTDTPMPAGCEEV